jgi:hypothetical protein
MSRNGETATLLTRPAGHYTEKMYITGEYHRFRYSWAVILMVVQGAMPLFAAGGITPWHELQTLPPPEVDVTGPAVVVITEEQVVLGNSASSRGEPRRREVIELREPGRDIGEQRVYLPARNLQSKSVFSYDAAARLTEIRTLSPEDEVLWRWEYRYGRNGNLEQEISYGPGGLLEQATVYQYRRGMLEQQTQYRFGTDVTWRRLFTWPAEVPPVLSGNDAPTGNIREWDLVGAQGERIRQVRETFDASGQLLVRQSMDQVGEIWEEVRNTVVGRRLVTRRYGPDQALLDERVALHDSAGNVIREEVRRRGTGNEVELISVITHAYRYDSWGNWVYRTTEFHDDALLITRRLIARREITYADG